jgi:hypothetical protein
MLRGTYLKFPALQNRQTRQGSAGSMATLSPFLNPVTPSPTSVTIPQDS